MELINDLRAKQKVSESLDDKDMLDMDLSELDEALEEEKRIQTWLPKSLLPKDEADERDCILEVRAGTGGEEASLFAMTYLECCGIVNILGKRYVYGKLIIKGLVRRSGSIRLGTED